MTWLFLILVLALLDEAVCLFNATRNYRYATKKTRPPQRKYQPSAALIVPCKGIDPGFDENIAPFCLQDYAHYSVWFVVGDPSDPAYERLLHIRDRLGSQSKARDIQIHIAGPAEGCSQKLHNQLYCIRKIPPEVRILAFADSDIRVGPLWLQHLIHPLHKKHFGATTGYRWFVPDRSNLATLALSALNAKVSQWLGNTRFNLAWGGSMAVRRDVFIEADVESIWSKALTDDLSLTAAIRRHRRWVAFVPQCLAPSHESTTWPGLFEFARRQLLITRVYCPLTWAVGLVGSAVAVLEWVCAVGATVWAALAQWTIPWVGASYPAWPVLLAISAMFSVGGFIKAALRQGMIRKVLPDHASDLRLAGLADLLGFWAWSILFCALMIASGIGRTLRWRGIRYRVLGPTRVVRLGPNG